MVDPHKDLALYAADSSCPLSFESAFQELEKIIQKMETADLSLEASLAAYQRGTELLKFCQNTLTTAEQKIQILESGIAQNFTTHLTES